MTCLTKLLWFLLVCLTLEATSGASSNEWSIAEGIKYLLPVFRRFSFEFPHTVIQKGVYKPDPLERPVFPPHHLRNKIKKLLADQQKELEATKETSPSSPLVTKKKLGLQGK